MVKSKNHIFTVVGFFVLIVTLIFLSPKRSYAPPPPVSPQPPQDVNVVNPETDPVPATVENLESNPVPTYDVDNPAFQPVHDLLTCSLSAEELICSDSSIALPAGKLLVIEHLSVFANLPSGQRPRVSFSVDNFRPSLGGVFSLSYSVPLEFVGTFFTDMDMYEGSQSARLYARPDTMVGFQFIRNSDVDNASASVRYSGYLVDVPE